MQSPDWIVSSFQSEFVSLNGVVTMADWIPTRQTTDADFSDEQLIALIKRGDFDAFEALAGRYQKSALRVARRFVGDEGEAEDMAQEAFLQLYRNAHQFRSDASFKTWFFRILTNLCLNQLKKKRPEYFDDPPFEIAAGDDPARAFELLEQRRAIFRALLKLPPRQRMAFILCCFEELSYADTASCLSLSVKAVESLMVRARRTLRGELSFLRQNISK
jgi:RNA polymerase sigma-70 factor, ECF subfamily